MWSAAGLPHRISSAPTRSRSVSLSTRTSLRVTGAVVKKTMTSTMRTHVRAQSTSAMPAASAAVSSSSTSFHPPSYRTTGSAAHATHTRTHGDDDNVFLIEEAIDVEWQLLSEAHYKHGVWLNVPPQLPPSTDAALEAWLAQDDLEKKNTIPDEDSRTGEVLKRVVPSKAGPSHFPVYYATAQHQRLRKGRERRVFSEIDTASFKTRLSAARQRVLAIQKEGEATTTSSPESTLAATAATPDSEAPSAATMTTTTASSSVPLSPSRSSRFVTAETAPNTTSTLSTPAASMLGLANAAPRVEDIQLLFLQDPSSPFAVPESMSLLATLPPSSSAVEPWAYIPTHAPPPLITTGTRSLLPLSSLTPTKLASASSTTATTTTTTSTAHLQTRTQSVARRAAIDTSMCVHCTVCGKPYRRRETARAHVLARHATSSSTADPDGCVGEGPGPGELIAYEDVAVTFLPSAPHIASPSAADASQAEHKNKNKNNNDNNDNNNKEKSSAAHLTTVMSSPLTPKTAPSSSQISPAREGSTTAAASSQPYAATPRVTLPADTLIDSLLCEVWDAIALTRDDVAHQPHHGPLQTSTMTSDTTAVFVPAAALVTANVDHRAEMAAAAEAKAPARATPVGAAPGIKRRPATPASSLSKMRLTNAAHVNSGHGEGGLVSIGGQAATLSIREMRKRYPNPFGDSAEGDALELTQEPVNPFFPLDDVGVARRLEQEGVATGREEESVACGATAAKGHLLCPICVRHEQQQQQEEEEQTGPSSAMAPRTRKFRLVDSVLNHVERAHANMGGLDALTAEDWRHLRGSTSFSTRSSSSSSTSTSSHVANNTQQAHQEEAQEGDVKNTTKGANQGAAQAPVTGASAATTDESAPTTGASSSSSSSSSSLKKADMAHVHARMATNMVIIGVVRDVQHGYIGSEAALQYVVETSSKTTTESDACETELIVVRCTGPHVPVALLQQQVRYGSRVYVCGALKMNRHVDSTSRRLHAYPYLHVSPPIGLIKAL